MYRDSAFYLRLQKLLRRITITPVCSGVSSIQILKQSDLFAWSMAAQPISVFMSDFSYLGGANPHTLRPKRIGARHQHITNFVVHPQVLLYSSPIRALSFAIHAGTSALAMPFEPRPQCPLTGLRVPRTSIAV